MSSHLSPETLRQMYDNLTRVALEKGRPISNKDKWEEEREKEEARQDDIEEREWLTYHERTESSRY